VSQSELGALALVLFAIRIVLAMHVDRDDAWTDGALFTLSLCAGWVLTSWWLVRRESKS
jgi:hypothetical protein